MIESSPVPAPTVVASPPSADFAEQIGQILLEDAAESLKILAPTAPAQADAGPGIPLAELGLLPRHEAAATIEEVPSPDEPPTVVDMRDQDEFSATVAIPSDRLKRPRPKKARSPSGRVPEDERDTDDLVE